MTFYRELRYVRMLPERAKCSAYLMDLFQKNELEPKYLKENRITISVYQACMTKKSTQRTKILRLPKEYSR